MNIERPSERPSRLDDGNAFLPDTVGQLQRLPADDAESFAEEFVASALMGESVHGDANDEVADDEEGGPFIALDAEHQLPTDGEGDGTLDALADAVDDPGATLDDPDAEGHDPVEHAQALRGARWAARGA